MPTLTVKTSLQAAPERCFDLARDIGLHCETASRTQERAVAGVTSGLIGLKETVTFEGVHFGIRQRFTAKVTEFDPPRRFVDEMTRGAFRAMKHIHEFAPQENGTCMTDTLIWTSPLGILGRIADTLFVERHLRNFLLERNAELKRTAETLSVIQNGGVPSPNP